MLKLPSQFVLPSPSLPGSTSLFSTSASLLFLPCKRIHWCHISRFHIYVKTWCLFFSDFLHSVWQTVDSSTSQQMIQFHSFLWQSCTYVPHLLYSFICQWTSRLLQCPGNSAAVHTGVHVSFCIMVFSGYMSSSGTAGSYGSSMFGFLRILHTVFIVAVSIYIPINSARGFPFPHSPPALPLHLGWQFYHHPDVPFKS